MPSSPYTPWQISLIISASLHLVVLLLIPSNFEILSKLDSQENLLVDLSSIEEVVISDSSSISIESNLKKLNSNEDQTKSRQKALFDYLDKVSAAIHSHRLDNQKTYLIGKASFMFDIDALGQFKNIRIKEKSSSTELDNAAFRAIQMASGEVERPTLLGNETIKVYEEVKFQYSLN